MAGSQVATIGPFAGGMNNALDPSSIRDNQLAEIVNFEVTEDGTLTNRPLITVNQWGFDYGTGGNGNESWQKTGEAVLPLAVGRYKNDGAAVLYKYIDGQVYWERMNNAANSMGIGLQKVIGLGHEGLRQPGFCAVQYLDRMVFTNARDPRYCGRTALGTTSFVKLNNMPLGETIFQHKGRIFIFPGPNTNGAENENNSKFFYSDAPYSFGDWDVTKNFIHVGYGDGEYITGALVYNGDILIFKENSTWRFSYEANIATGMLEEINPSVGSDTPHSFVLCNGVVYTFFQGALHEIYNYQWRNVSEDIVFDPLNETEEHIDKINLGVLGSRVIVNYYGRTYVYNQRSRTWSMWETDNKPGRMITVNAAVLDNFNKDMLLASYYKHTRGVPAHGNNNWRITRLFRVFDDYHSLTDIRQSQGERNEQDREDFECRIETKTYDLGADSAFKRLMWWGASVLTRTDVQGQALVIVNNASFTHDDLDGTPYEELNQATWDHLLDILPRVETEIDGKRTASHGRRFFKFLKGLRFRQISFSYKTWVDGTSDTIPTKLFTFTAIFRGKTKLSKEIS